MVQYMSDLLLPGSAVMVSSKSRLSFNFVQKIDGGRIVPNGLYFSQTATFEASKQEEKASMGQTAQKLVCRRPV